MEEISKENATISKPTKEKKARSQKQIEAFKLCAERRKQKLLEKKQNPTSTVVSHPVINQTTSSEHEYKKLAEQIEMLKNQVVDMKQSKQRIMMPVINEESMDVDVDESTPYVAPQRVQFRQQEPQEQQERQQQFQFQRRQDMIGKGLGYSVHNQYQNSNNRKRDVRGMDPYIDEKQGMMEKIYSRNVNQMKQKQIDVMDRRRMMDDNSIQLLAPQESQAGVGVDVDRNAPVENMTTMIRSSAFTNAARKQSAVSFNGYRVASRR